MIALLALAATVPALASAERAAIFIAAGAVRKGKGWAMCQAQPGMTAQIDEVRDVNGDGRPEAVVTETAIACYGGDETGFAVVSKGADGRWTRIVSMGGAPEFLGTKGTNGWPDLRVGGQGFCFPVLRWNGRAYANHRREYEGKPCR